MAENVDDPIEESALHQEKVLAHHDGNGTSIMRVLSRKSTRNREDVTWTEEVKRIERVTPQDSSETTLGDQEEGGEEDRGPIAFDVDDPLNPKTWSEGRKWYISVAATVGVLNSTFASSAPSGALRSIQASLGANTEVSILVVSMYIVGYILGPIVFAPFSERFGRRRVFLITLGLYSLTQIGCALAPNIETLIVMRLLGGTFGSSPLVIVGGILADIWESYRRGQAMSMFSATTFLGPTLGPFIAGFLSMTGPDGWRWLFWILFIFGGVSTIVLFFTLPETYAPILLRDKAEKVRAETGDTLVYAAIEREDRRILKLLKITLSRPFQLLFGDIIIFLVCLYLSFCYGVQYLFFQAYPIIFEDIHGLNPGESGLAFVAVTIGSCIGCCLSQYWDYRRQRPKQKSEEDRSSGPKPLPSSEHLRLPTTMIAGPLFIISYFWLGWTSYAYINPVVTAMAGLWYGAACLFLLSGFFNYLTDCYYYAASALAASTITRSCFGAGFPLFTRAVFSCEFFADEKMFDTLGVQWACSLLGFISIPMALIPYWFYKYGPQLRARSKYTFQR